MGADDTTGVVVPYAVGYKNKGGDGSMAAMYELGGWQDNSDYTDPLRDRNGNPAAPAASATKTSRGARACSAASNNRSPTPIRPAPAA